MNVAAMFGIIETAESQGLERFYLVLPRRAGAGRRMRVLPGLLGEICCDTDRGTTVLVRCDEARAWLKAHRFEGTFQSWGLDHSFLQGAIHLIAAGRGPFRIRFVHPGAPVHG